jgi:hypothetical protein
MTLGERPVSGVDMPDQQDLNIPMKSAVHNRTAGFFMPHDVRFLSRNTVISATPLHALQRPHDGFVIFCCIYYSIFYLFCPYLFSGSGKFFWSGKYPSGITERIKM